MWYDWIPTILNLAAYAAGQLIGHKQGASTRPPAIAAAPIVDVINAAAERAGTLAGVAAYNASQHPSFAQGPVLVDPREEPTKP
jgi:hypothetical protein